MTVARSWYSASANPVQGQLMLVCTVVHGYSMNILSAWIVANLGIATVCKFHIRCASPDFLPATSRLDRAIKGTRIVYQNEYRIECLDDAGEDQEIVVKTSIHNYDEVFTDPVLQETFQHTLAVHGIQVMTQIKRESAEFTICQHLTFGRDLVDLAAMAHEKTTTDLHVHAKHAKYSPYEGLALQAGNARAFLINSLAAASLAIASLQMIC